VIKLPQNRTRNKQVVLRLTDEEYEKLKKKIEKSKLNQNDFLLSAALNKKIHVVEGIRDLTNQIKKIGNNLNQLTKLAHEGRVNCKNEIEEIKKGLGESWQLLRVLMAKITRKGA
jgi:uncharacterized protein (DUF1778 family)